MVRLLAVLLVLFAVHRAEAAINVFACEPEWGALAEEIGGEAVSVYVATSAKQDPHQLQARPSLIAKARSADLVVCTGAELEIGWMPVILRQAANGKIQPGTPGYFEAAAQVRLKDVPTVLDRSQGDVHAQGNPHIQTDPRTLVPVAAALAERLMQIDPGNAARYRERHQAFTQRWSQALQRWQMEAASLKGTKVAVQHKNWTYLIDWLGLVEVTTLEPKPGVPPSSGHLAEVLAKVTADPVRLVIRAAYEDGRPSVWLAERARVPAVELPFTVGGNDQATDLTRLYDDTLRRLKDAVR
ncbi:MAG: zinc ABC transporter substrate-binding protein [Rhodospirillaceae bacterium]|nr:zinc ABC transporter substrate-binding protein [Rhodospirillaceae bacterium]